MIRTSRFLKYRKKKKNIIWLYNNTYINDMNNSKWFFCRIQSCVIDENKEEKNSLIIHCIKLFYMLSTYIYSMYLICIFVFVTFLVFWNREMNATKHLFTINYSILFLIFIHLNSFYLYYLYILYGKGVGYFLLWQERWSM